MWLLSMQFLVAFWLVGWIGLNEEWMGEVIMEKLHNAATNPQITEIGNAVINNIPIEPDAHQEL